MLDLVALEVARIDRNSLHSTGQNRDLRSDMRKSVSPLNQTAGFFEAEELLQNVSKPDSQVGHMPPPSSRPFGAKLGRYSCD